MPEGIPIVATSRNGEDIPSLEMIENNESSTEDQIEELESKVTSNSAESRIEEALDNQNTLGLNADPSYADDDLGVIEDAEPNKNIEIEDEVVEETFDNKNLSLEQWVNMLKRLQRIACKEAIDLFADVELLENYRTRNKIIEVTMLYKATGDFKKDYSLFKPNL